MSDVELTFLILAGDRSRASLSPTRATTDANGRAQTTLTFKPDAAGDYIIEVYPSDHFALTQFTIAVDPSLPQATRLEKISGREQSGFTGEPLTNPFVVEVRDQHSDPMEGVTVTFAVTAGGGSLSAATVTTNQNGQAKSRLTLGTEPGTHTVKVSVERISQTVTFNAEATLPPPTPTRLSILSGENQEGLIGEPLTNPFIVQVHDQYDVPLADAMVTFAVTAGGGSLSATTAITDQDGQAKITLTFGTEPGTHTVQVSAEGIVEIVTFNAEATLPPPTPTRLSILSGENQEGLIGEPLTNPFIVQVRDQYGNPMAGVAVRFVVRTGGGTLSNPTATTDANGQVDSTLHLGTAPGTNTVEVSVEGIAEIVTFRAVVKLFEFDLSLPSGIRLIHVPLKVTAVDGMAKTIASIADLYDALGGTNTVNFLVTYAPQTQQWFSYVGPWDKGTSVDVALTDDTGIIVSMKAAVSVRLQGEALGTDGTSTITLNEGPNLVGLPLRDSRVTRVSDLFALDGIGGHVSTIIVIDNGAFKTVGRAGDPRDIAITGGQSFILMAQNTATVDISGEPWSNAATMGAAPLVSLKGLNIGNTTSILALRGTIVDNTMGLNEVGFHVTVKNLSTGRADAIITTPDAAGYRFTVVDIEAGRAAMIGDILEISAQSPNPFIGVQPLWYTVTDEDVKRNLIQLPILVAYEIPVETELLHNYPNPFNPETWIPYHLASDTQVTLTIYDTKGAVVRRLDLGHQLAGYYTDRAKAAYWDGRNESGESVASGVYFYALIVRSETRADDYSATRKMLILK